MVVLLFWPKKKKKKKKKILCFIRHVKPWDEDEAERYLPFERIIQVRPSFIYIILLQFFYVINSDVRKKIVNSYKSIR